MKNLIIKVIVLCSCLCLLAGCSADLNKIDSQEESETVITVMVPKSPASIPVFRMLESKALGDNISMDIQIFDSMESMIAMASGMDYSFIVLPVHTAAVLYNKDLDIKLMSVFTWGGMTLATTDNSCTSWEDLENKDLYVLSKGSVPDILTQFFLDEYELKTGENIEIVYSTYPEISQLMALGTIEYAVDGQPYSTSNNENIENYRVITNYSEQWKRMVGDEYSLPAYGLAANGTFLSGNEELTQIFMEEFENAVDWMTNNPEEAGELIETSINANGALIAKAMPNFNFYYVSSKDAIEDVGKYYEILFSYKPQSVGGIIPDENFYYKNK